MAEIESRSDRVVRYKCKHCGYVTGWPTSVTTGFQCPECNKECVIGVAYCGHGKLFAEIPVTLRIEIEHNSAACIDAARAKVADMMIGLQSGDFIDTSKGEMWMIVGPIKVHVETEWS